MKISTAHSLVITLLALLFGFIWSTFYPGAPYVAYSGTVGIVFGAYATKRLLQKKGEFIEQDS